MSYSRTDLEEKEHASKSKVKKDSFDCTVSDEEKDEIGDPSSPRTKKWKELNSKEKTKIVAFAIAKGISLTLSMFFFICSLDLLSCAFRLIGGRPTGSLFRDSTTLNNPIVGVMIGLLVTVVVQSSSTTTSILVGLVSSHLITVKAAIPFVMGANIGTSITNALVSLGQIGDRHQFKLAFAGACLHDAFNFLSVFVLLIVEVCTNYLYHLTKLIVESTQKVNKGKPVETLSYLTKPIVNKIVKINSKVLMCLSTTNCTNFPASIIQSSEIFPRSWSDITVGVIVLIVSLLVLFICLLLTVKILKSILQGQLAKIVKRTVNANIPYVPWLAGYIAIAVGAMMTFLLQSSSVFTSAMTPLIGIGVISINRAYPLTLGANVGTCITAIIASLAVEGDSFYPAFQIALCHLFFNLTGILLFYPIPFMRFPVGIAKYIGRQTAKYRWFAVAYMLLMFFVLPLIVLGLSFAGVAYVFSFVGIVTGISLLVAIINVLQEKKPTWLPNVLRTWLWLPLALRSLKPYDDFLMRFSMCRIDKKEKDSEHILHSQTSENDLVVDSPELKADSNNEREEKDQPNATNANQVQVVNEKIDVNQPN